MTTILAHRANLSGSHSVIENSLTACRRALEEGFGLETDLRRDTAGKYYISHDPAPRSTENMLDGYSELFRQFPGRELAINVKELGYEQSLIDLMMSDALGARSFFFDFELLETSTPGATQRKIRSFPRGDQIRLASRLSDRHEPLAQCLSIPADVVWADEFDSLWLTGREIEQIHAAGRLFYAISPELHEFDRAAMLRRWADFRTWRIDGICTDYALEARDFFGD